LYKWNVRPLYLTCRIVVFLLLIQALALDAFILSWYGWPLVHGGFKELDDRIAWSNTIYATLHGNGSLTAHEIQFATRKELYVWLIVKFAACIVVTAAFFVTRRFLIRRIAAMKSPESVVSPQSS
jgi:hypothetical protein